MQRTIDLTALIDRPTLGHFRVRMLVLCLLISVADGFDVQAMAFVAPVLTNQWRVPPLIMGQILTAGLIGLLVGNVALGRLSDQFGRRPVLLGSTVCFGLSCLATSLCTTTAQLVVARILTGIGLGGAIVSALALTSEYAPARSRATLVTAMFVGFPIGGSIGGLLAAPIISMAGWQGIFLVGGVLPLVLLTFVWPRLPESPAYLVVSGAAPERIGHLVQQMDAQYRYSEGDRFVQADAAHSAHIAELFVPKRLPGTALIWLICLANLLVLYLLINWLPSLLHRSGLSLVAANLGAVAFNLGGILGGLALSGACDRLGAFRVLPITYVAAALVILLLARAGSVPLSFVLTFLAGCGVLGAQFCVNALAAGFYPAAIRSTGVGCALGFGRIGSIAGPVLGGVALGSGATMGAIFSAIAIPIMMCAGAVAGLATVYRRGAPQID